MPPNSNQVNLKRAYRQKQSLWQMAAEHKLGYFQLRGRAPWEYSLIKRIRVASFVAAFNCWQTCSCFLNMHIYRTKRFIKLSDSFYLYNSAFFTRLHMIASYCIVLLNFCPSTAHFCPFLGVWAQEKVNVKWYYLTTLDPSEIIQMVFNQWW